RIELYQNPLLRDITIAKPVVEYSSDTACVTISERVDPQSYNRMTILENHGLIRDIKGDGVAYRLSERFVKYLTKQSKMDPLNNCKKYAIRKGVLYPPFKNTKQSELKECFCCFQIASLGPHCVGFRPGERVSWSRGRSLSKPRGTLGLSSSAELQSIRLLPIQ